MLINEEAMISPSKTKRFWLSDYIHQKRHSEGKRDSTSRLGIARRMPRVNRSHEKRFEDTLKMLTKTGEPDPIIIQFQERFGGRQRGVASGMSTARNRCSLSPRQFQQKKQMNKFKKLSGDLIERIRTQNEASSMCWTPKPLSRYNKMQQKAVFQIKASDEWMRAQQQILKINLKQEMARLEKRRIKKIRLGIDNRTIQELINELRN